MLHFILISLVCATILTLGARLDRASAPSDIDVNSDLS